MIFNSIEFLIFFAAVFTVYFLTPSKFRWVLLLAASYFFYGFARLEYLPLLIIPTILVYFITLRISRTQDKRKRKQWLLLGLTAGLAGLIVFKYTDFLGNTAYSIAGLFMHDIRYNPLALIFPIGISFYSFKLISYLIDVYNDNCPVEKHFGYFALYVASFPQLLAGPIDRAVNFIPQLKQKVNFDVERILSGFRLVVWGVFKKMVISDRVAFFVNEVFSKPDQQGINLIFGAYFYAFQIYCDFSGYSDMAIGISRILGFESMKNFDFPYFSTSMTQFWNRWHISLSTWLRDYLFLPIAYAVMRPIKTPKLYKIKAETWGYVIGMFITMFLGGLWHKPTWTMVIWGCLHGIFLGVGYTTKRYRKRLRKKIKLNKSPRLKNLISGFITFNLVSFAWIFFRAESFEKAIHYIKNINFTFTGQGMGYLLFNIVLVLVFVAMELVYKNSEKWTFVQRIPALVKIAGFALFICLIIIFAVDTSNEFIYFQF